MSQLKLIDTCAAYDVVEMPMYFDKVYGNVPSLKDGDLLATKGRGFWNEYTIGSVIGCALKWGNNPDEMVARP